jgi:fructose-1,6-bisphosphatase/inositol monophosphatase family enzyme
MVLEQERDTMLLAARKAGVIALRHFQTGVATEVKPDLSPVTEADRECERVICRIVSDAFPDDGIVGEEGARKSSLNGRRWLIDPIDGTRDFVRHNTFWSVQLALEAQGAIILGAIYFPCLDEMLYASRDSGCFWNETPAQLASTPSLDKAILLVSGLKAAGRVWDPGAVHRLAEICWTVRAYGAGYDIVMLATGRGDIWLSGSGMEWDYAPARIIAEELGARFITRDGTSRIDAHHCLICPPALESELRAVLRMPA